MVVERVVRNRLGFVKETPVPEGGENLMVKRQNMTFPAKIKVLGRVVELTQLIQGIVGGGALAPASGKNDVDLSQGKERRIKGRDESGAKVVYRYVPDKMNPLQKIARALHR